MRKKNMLSPFFVFWKYTSNLNFELNVAWNKLKSVFPQWSSSNIEWTPILWWQTKILQRTKWKNRKELTWQLKHKFLSPNNLLENSNCEFSRTFIHTHTPTHQSRITQTWNWHDCKRRRGGGEFHVTFMLNWLRPSSVPDGFLAFKFVHLLDVMHWMI